MNFLEGSVLVAEMATFAVWAELLPVELSAILGLVLLVETGLGFSDPVDLCELLVSVSVLALVPISAEADFGPVFAHFSLVFLSVLRKNLSVQAEMDMIVIVIVILVAQLALTHGWCRVESWLERGLGRLGERERVGVHRHLVLGAALGGLRNWSERGRASVLWHKSLEVSLHGEV